MKVSVCSLALSVLLGSNIFAAKPTEVLPVGQRAVERGIPEGPDTALSQAPNQVDGHFSDLGCDFCPTGVRIIGENFVVNTGGLEYEPDEITIWGGFYPNDTPVPVTFDIFVYAAGYGGLPVSTPTCHATGISPTSDTLTGITLFGVSEHEILLEISDCILHDGTYWLVWFTDTGLGTDDFFWETGVVDATTGIVGALVSHEYPPPSWGALLDTDLGVVITGTGALAIFCADFEEGNTLEWTISVP